MQSDLQLESLFCPKRHIGVFIDADNVPWSRIGEVFNGLFQHGTLSIRRAYGNWKSQHLDGWAKILHQHGIQAMQQFDLVKGKNATDMAMTVDVMDVLYTKPIDVFCIVSSDSDFTPLVTRLRSEGKVVIGWGDHKASDSFINACSHFMSFDKTNENMEEMPVNSLEQELLSQGKEALGKMLKGDTRLMNLLRGAISQTVESDGWSRLSKVGRIVMEQTDFDFRQYGFRKLSDLFMATDMFEVRRGEGDLVFVRNRVRLPIPSLKRG